MRRAQSYFILTFLTLSLCSACVSQNDYDKAWSKAVPPRYTSLHKSVVALQKLGRYDEASQLIRGNMRDQQSNDFLLYLLSVTYLERAQEDSKQRVQWTEHALEFAERAYNANSSDVVNLYWLGESYFAAGTNVPSQRGCEYFAKAKKVFANLAATPMLNQRTANIEGEEYAMSIWRKKLDDKISAVGRASSDCK